MNPLDSACKLHDIAYYENSDLETRHKADQQLIQAAKERIRAKDASLGEKLAASGVTSIIGAKKFLGMGMRKKRNNKQAKKSKLGRGFLLPAIHGIVGGVTLYKTIRDMIKKKQGNGFHLKPYKKFAGSGMKSKKNKKKKN